MSEDRLRHLNAIERQALREFIAELRQRYGSQIVDVQLFGSRARGDASPESDLDLLIVIADDEQQVKAEIDHLGAHVDLKYGVVLSDVVMSVDRFEWHRRHQAPFYKNIMRDGIRLWTGMSES